MDRKTEADTITCEPSHPESGEEFEVSSEASTEVGSDGERSDEELDNRSIYTAHVSTGEHRCTCEEEDEDATAKPLDSLVAEASVDMPSRPRFARVSRGQRLAQLARVLAEFCSLDFNAVDAVAQSAVVLRMLALLRSLRNKEVYHDRDGTRCTEERYALLGLAAESTELIVLDKLVRQTEVLVDDRSFRSAFELLCEARPLFIRCCQDVGTACGTPLDDDQAMALRRWLRKQKQREERRQQRATDRAHKPCRGGAKVQLHKVSAFAGEELQRPKVMGKVHRSHPRT